MSDAAAAPAGDNGATGATSATLTGAAPAAPTSQQTAPAAPAPAASGIEWLSGADEAMSGYVQNKGWKSPVEAINSYQNLEKLLGADRAGRTVVLPGEGATPEEMSKFFDKLGRPADAGGYKIEVPQQGGDPEFAKVAAGWFHELGLSQKQGEALATKWNQYMGGMAEQIEATRQANFQTEDTALKAEWGSAYTQKLAEAQAAVRALNLDAASIDKLSSALGHKATMNLLSRIGGKAGEADFATGEGSFGSALTPAAAKDQIKSLMADKSFATKYMNGDLEAKNKMAELHKFAYPEA